MNSTKIVEIVVLLACAGVIAWGVRTRKGFYVVAAIIIALSILVDLAA